MFAIKQKFKKLIDKTGYVQQLKKEIEQLNNKFFYPPGHFYSPIVDTNIIKDEMHSIWLDDKTATIQGIDLNEQEQFELIKAISAYYNEIPFSENQQPNTRYYFKNNFYSYSDGIVLYGLMRHFKPKRIVEIGSGFSSAAMLDTNEIFFNNEIKLTFVEPYAERLFSLLKQPDKQVCTIIEESVQQTSPEIYRTLEAGDFLFIDSSHVAKTGSDVNHIFFNLLPLLKKGVIIHIHDVFFPFEYPKDWVLEGRSWNEDYFLKAFLMYNPYFKTLLFSDYLHRFYPHVFKEMPLCYKNTGGNFWMKKLS